MLAAWRGKEWLRALAAWTCVAALLLPLLATADNENRVLIDGVDFESKEMLLTIHADVLDVKGLPIESLAPESLAIEVNGKLLQLVPGSVQVQTADKAQEPISVVLLLNASRAYQNTSEDEKFSTFKEETAGAVAFLQRLSGNDTVAVISYNENTAHDLVYSFGSDFKQAQQSVETINPHADVLEDPTNAGVAKKEAGLAPDFIMAVSKALGYFRDTLDKNSKVKSARRRYLVLQSDGKDKKNDKAKLTRAVATTLEKFADTKIRIFTLGFSPDTEDYLSILQAFSNGSGGAYTYINNREGLTDISRTWDNIGRRLKKQYVITAKVAELPDWGERIQGKDEANYALKLKVKMPDGGDAEADFNDLHLPLPSTNWGKILKWVGIVLGGLLGVGLLIFVIVLISRRKPAESGEGGGGRVQQAYDGPSRGKLTVLQGPLAGNVFPLIDDVTTIGSMKGNTIIIEDQSVSRRHAAIKIDQMRYEVADMNSTNGVLVNGAKIIKIFLKDGDRIQIGTTEIVFSLK
jgi:hypothetical protein